MVKPITTKEKRPVDGYSNKPDSAWCQPLLNVNFKTINDQLFIYSSCCGWLNCDSSQTGISRAHTAGYHNHHLLHIQVLDEVEAVQAQPLRRSMRETSVTNAFGRSTEQPDASHPGFHAGY